jgi:hypothetical protein
MKKSLIAGILIVFCLSISAGAVSLPNTNEEENVTVFSETVSNNISSIFENKANYKIIDSNGTDITQEFFSRHAENYANGKIQMIVDDLSDNRLTVAKKSEVNFGDLSLENSLSDGVIKPMAIVGMNVRQNYTVYPKVLNQVFSFSYDITGTFRVNDYSGLIESATNAMLDTKSIVSDLKPADKPGSSYKYSLFNGSGSYYIQTPAKKVNFYGSFILVAHTKNFEASSGQIPISNYFVANSNGTVESHN